MDHQGPRFNTNRVPFMQTKPTAPVEPLQTFRTFRTGQDALIYRHQTGCGGWVFVPEDDSVAVIFPYTMTPSQIFHHPLWKSRFGELIGCQ